MSVPRSTFVDAAAARAILALAVPMVVSNLSVPLLGLVDTAVIGHLSEASYLAGVALGAMVSTTVAWLLAFLRMSTTGIVAQCVGRKDPAGVRAALARGLLYAAALGALVLLLRTPIYELVLRLAQPSASVAQSFADYLFIRLWGTPAALCNLVLLGWLLGMQDARSPMWLLILANTLNIALDLLLVVVFSWGVEGVAAASVIAEYAALGVALLLVRRRLRRQRDPAWPSLRQLFDRAALRRLFSLNANIFIRSVCLQLTFTFLTIQGARLGDVVVATNAVLLNFLLLTAYGLDGLAYAVEALIGRHLGAGAGGALRATVRTALAMAGVAAVLSSLVFALAGQPLVQLLTDLDAIRTEAARYLPWLVLLPLTAVWCFVLDGVFIGATWAADMRNSMLLSTFGVYFPLYGLAAGLGNHALWLALNGFMLARGVSLFYLYRRRCGRGGLNDEPFCASGGRPASERRHEG